MRHKPPVSSVFNLLLAQANKGKSYSYPHSIALYSSFPPFHPQFLANKTNTLSFLIIYSLSHVPTRPWWVTEPLSSPPVHSTNSITEGNMPQRNLLQRLAKDLTCKSFSQTILGCLNVVLPPFHWAMPGCKQIFPKVLQANPKPDYAAWLIGLFR